MRIKSINISAFGGVKNLQIEPNDGLNIIYGDNENGKTTVMAFIKMMFYGSERASSQLSKNIRKKYTPWDGGTMGGSIEFEHSGKNYRLEREFKGSNATDRVVLCDLDLGTRETAPPDIGIKFFGLTAAAFERSVFIGQFGYPESDTKAEGEINSKLSNIALTGDESVSFETVNTRLTKAKTALMSKSGNAGIYDKNVKAITDLRARLEKSAAIAESYRLTKEKLAIAEGEITAMQKKADTLKEKISAEQDVRNAGKLKNLLKLKSELDSLNETLKLSDGTLADESYVKKLQFCYSKTQSAADKVKAKQSEIELLKKSIAATDTSPQEKEAKKAELERQASGIEKSRAECKAKLQKAKQEESEILLKLSDPDRFKKKVNPVFLILGAVALVLGFASLAIKLEAVAAVGIALGTVLAVLGFAIRPTDKNALEEMGSRASALREEIFLLTGRETDLNSQLSALQIKLEAINTALSGNIALLENQKQLLSDSENQLKELEIHYKTENQTLLGLLARSGGVKDENIGNEIEKIAEGASKQKEIKQQINYILKDVGNISYKQAEEKLKNIGDNTDITADFDDLKKELEKLLGAITEGKTNIAATKARAQAAMISCENPETLKQKIAELSKTAEAQREFCSATEIALQVLADSFSEVRRSYGSELEKKAAEILSALTGGKYSAMGISKSLDITAEEREKFVSREIGYLSSGTADQAYLSLRLALSRLMADSEGLPVLMDDSLSQYDDKRLKTAMEFLKDYSNENQIILFTCHSEVCRLAEALGAETKKLT